MKNNRIVLAIFVVFLLLVVSASTALSSSTSFLQMGNGTPFTYNGIPFELSGVSLIVYKTSLGFVSNQSIDLSGYTTEKIHIIENAGWADNVPDGIVVGYIKVHYEDGSSETLDLTMGVNIAEWSYDRAEMQPYLQHSKVPPAYSWWTNEGSANFYWGHRFYVQIATTNKPLDYLELILDPISYTGQQYYGYSSADWFGIDISAITLEVGPSELIINGDFEEGNTGFSTDYKYNGNHLPTLPHWVDLQEYTVYTSPELVHQYWVHYGDKTSGTGNMLIVNAATAENQTVWRQTVAVIPNTDYVFTYWLSSCHLINPAKLHCSINGTTIGTASAPSTTGVWEEIAYSWNSGPNSTATIRLVELTHEYIGNDFAIDDISFITEPPEEGPYISSIEPSSGAPGIDVKIKGFGFPANPWVNFGGKPRPAVSWSNNEVVVKVPPGKGIVDVYVTVMTGWPKSNPVKFTYKDPVIQEIYPSSGRPGEKITIKGSDFGGPDPLPVIGDLFVKVGKSRARLITWTDKELEVEAPWDYGLGKTEEATIWLIKLIVEGWTSIPSEFVDQISELIVELSNAGVEIKEGEGKIVVGIYVENTAGRRSNTERFTFYVPDIIQALLRSPGELGVYDADGNVTGIVNGEVRKQIPYSHCSDNNILIAYPSGSYTYEVVGTSDGVYGLSIISGSDGENIGFEASNLPISPGTIHQYTIDWDALSSGEEGVILNIDNDGDGVFVQMVIADNELSYDEFALQTETVVDFDPDTLNLKSEGKFATVYIELPDDFDVSEIDVFSLELNELVPPLPKPIEIADYDSDGINDLMVKFDLQELIEVLEPGEQMIDLTGRLWDDRPIAGFDFIRVIH